MRLRLILEYDGGGTSGWQIQESPVPPFTIQGAAEDALRRLTGQKIRVYGAGRTDAGVHALAQNAHFDAPDDMAGRNWLDGLNALLPPGIRAREVFAVPEDFHARKSALSKTYAYYFWTNGKFAPPRLRDFTWACGELDEGKIIATVPAFLGKHDFSSFRNAGSKVKNAVREIFEMKWESADEGAFFCDGGLARLTVRGDGFLKQMVRNIAGFLVAIGKGKISPDALEEIFAARDRRKLLTVTAPARGLFLARVDYPDKFTCRPPQTRWDK